MTTTLQATHSISAKLMAGEEADAIAAAAVIDNPGAKVEDHGSYLTIRGERTLKFSMATIANELGRPYDVPTLLVVLATYTGQVNVEDDGLVITEALSG